MAALLLQNSTKSLICVQMYFRKYCIGDTVLVLKGEKGTPGKCKSISVILLLPVALCVIEL